MKSQWIGLLDCNNFFVSCERLFRPDLQNKPVVVLSGNDGCIVARSQEVKDMNVPMGVPYFQVKDILQNVATVTFSSHFALYRDISRRVFTVMKEELDLVQQYSVDEAFFAVEDDPEDMALHVKEVVEKKVGIPVSIGVAHTKTQAKYASSCAKKGSGVFVLSAEKWCARTPDIPIQQIWGVGGKMEINYKKHGLSTVSKLIEADTSRVAQLFGVGGVRLQKELSGEAVFSLESKAEPQKSIMSSRSFGSETSDIAVLHDAAAYHVRHAMSDLRGMGRKTSVVRLSIQPSRHGDFLLRGGSNEAILTAPTNDTFVVLKAVQDLLEELFESGVPYKKTGITLSQFVSDEVSQGDLFSTTKKDGTETLMPVIDALNIKNGRELVVFGSRLKTNKWQPKSASRSPSYTTSWKDVAVVKT